MNDRLSLPTGPLRFTKFREILGLDYCMDWDNCAALQASRTTATFTAARNDFTELVFEDTDFINQKEYLSRVKKPRSMEVNELVARLRVINLLMTYLPGYGGNPGYDDQELKVLFYQIMLSDWKLAYFKTAHCCIIWIIICLLTSRLMHQTISWVWLSNKTTDLWHIILARLVTSP